MVTVMDDQTGPVSGWIKVNNVITVSAYTGILSKATKMPFEAERSKSIKWKDMVVYNDNKE